MEFTLRPANLEDLPVILQWVTSPELLRLWGGPALTFPAEATRIWNEIGATGNNAFSLVDPDGNVAGFGQVLCREPNTVHLGRIIVSPSRRGTGIGRLLCQRLIQIGTTQYQPSSFTLNVYTNNAPAQALYQSLGFTVISENKEQGTVMMCLRA